jgi:hypothetical protein
MIVPVAVDAALGTDRIASKKSGVRSKTYLRQTLFTPRPNSSYSHPASYSRKTMPSGMSRRRQTLYNKSALIVT